MISPFHDREGRVVSLLGRIDSSHVDVLVDQLLRLETENSRAITLYVSSTGGTLIDAFKIVDVLGTLSAPVTAIAMGLVQGAGVIAFAAAPERLILPNTLLSTAGLWTGLASTGVHSRDYLLDQLEVQTHQLNPAILGRLVREAATAPRLFTATEAIQTSLADTMAPTRKSRQTPKATCHVR